MSAPQASRRLQLRLKDMDRLGHLNNSGYHDFFFEVRSALMDSVRTENERFVVARVEVEFLHEVRLADEYVEVTARSIAVGHKSIKLEQEMRLPNGTLAARSLVFVVAWDVAARRSRPLATHERAALSPD
jgi:acyl-CoA thioesterase FadM